MRAGPSEPTVRGRLQTTASCECWRHDWVLDLDIKAFFDPVGVQWQHADLATVFPKEDARASLVKI